MRRFIVLPLAAVAGLMLAVAPAAASSPACAPSVATIQSLQGGGGNLTRQPDQICNTAASKVDQSAKKSPSQSANAQQLWPEKAMKLRQRGIDSNYQVPAPGA